MVIELHQISLEVIHIFVVEGEVYTLVKLLSGAIDVNMILEVEGTGDQWRVIAFARIPAETHAMGIRGVSLEAMSDKAEIRPGMRLFVRN